jgi:hypothetical protein
MRSETGKSYYQQQKHHPELKSTKLYCILWATWKFSSHWNGRERHSSHQLEPTGRRLDKPTAYTLQYVFSITQINKWTATMKQAYAFTDDQLSSSCYTIKYSINCIRMPHELHNGTNAHVQHTLGCTTEERRSLHIFHDVTVTNRRIIHTIINKLW